MLKPSVRLGDTDRSRLQQLDDMVARNTQNKGRKAKAMASTVRMDEKGQLHLGQKSRKKAWFLRSVYTVLQFVPLVGKKVNRAINDIQLKNESQQADAVKWLNSLPKANSDKDIQLTGRKVKSLTERSAVTLQDTCLFVNQRLQSNQLVKDHHAKTVPNFSEPSASSIVFRHLPGFGEEV
ncbi:hypothetical protein [Spongorhabdus nitratireducens]